MISKHRSARALTSMGKLLLTQKKFDKALGYFKRSVEVQPFQVNFFQYMRRFH